MFQIGFGSHCFRNPGGEETMELIIASKAEFPDIWEFGKSSIKKNVGMGKKRRLYRSKPGREIQSLCQQKGRRG